MKDRVYIAADLNNAEKSFYASVECIDRGLDSLATNHRMPKLKKNNKLCMP